MVQSGASGMLHAMPQPPQFWVVLGSVSHPFSVLPSQSSHRPAWMVVPGQINAAQPAPVPPKYTHAPAPLQPGVCTCASSKVQLCPQLPQLVTLDGVSQLCELGSQ
jgi:hypothetical protein